MDSDNVSAVLMALLLLGLFLTFIVIVPVLNYRNPERFTGTVSEEYIKRYSKNDYFHVVVVLDEGTQEIFQNRDAFWVGKFNSADLQQEIEIGRRYIFFVRGSRIRFLSMFRNIIDVNIIDVEDK